MLTREEGKPGNVKKQGSEGVCDYKEVVLDSAYISSPGTPVNISINTCCSYKSAHSAHSCHNVFEAHCDYSKGSSLPHQQYIQRVCSNGGQLDWRI